MKNTLDIKKELSLLLFTDVDTDPIARPFRWRSFRRDENKRRVCCPSCNPDINGYIEGQFGCPYCEGLGYLFDEKIIQGYIYKQASGKDKYNLGMPTTAGKSTVSDYILVTRASIKPQLEDKISVFKLTEDSKIAIPIHYEDTYKVIYTRDLRASLNNSDYTVTFLGG